MLLKAPLRSKLAKFCVPLLMCQFFPPQARGEELLHTGIYGGVQFSTYTVEISEAMWPALKAFNPDFTVWDREDYVPGILKHYELTQKQCPQAVFGDFNGDLTGDVVLNGHDKKQMLHIAILSYKKDTGAFGYKVQIIRKGPLFNPKELPCSSPEIKGLGAYLTYSPPKRFKSEFEEKPLNLKTDAFELQDACVSSTALYYYKDGEFHTYITGD